MKKALIITLALAKAFATAEAKAQPVYANALIFGTSIPDRNPGWTTRNPGPLADIFTSIRVRALPSITGVSLDRRPKAVASEHSGRTVRSGPPLARQQNEREAPVTRFRNCAELRRVYPNGVSRSGNPRIYAANSRLDRDKDGWACERNS